MTAGDLGSEKLQRVPSTASLDPAESRAQATEALSQAVQHGEIEEDVQTRHPAKQDLTADSPEHQGASAQADVKEDEHSPTDDIKNDVSISSTELRYDTGGIMLNFKKEPSRKRFEVHKKNGTRDARAAAIYTEGLELRVGALEREVLELLYEVGSKERPKEERHVESRGNSYSPSNLAVT